MAGAVSLPTCALFMAYVRIYNHITCIVFQWKWHLENNYIMQNITCLKMNILYKTKRNVCRPMSNARKCKTSTWMQITELPKNCWINLHKRAGKRKSRANGCREGEETAFANWLAWAWYLVRIACVMELNRKFIFVNSSLENFHFLLEISASSDWILYLLQGR
jgi:hypothetical protein